MATSFVHLRWSKKDSNPKSLLKLDVETVLPQRREEDDEKFSQSQNPKPQIRHTHLHSHPPLTVILDTFIFFFTPETTSSSHFAPPYFTAALMAAR